MKSLKCIFIMMLISSYVWALPVIVPSEVNGVPEENAWENAPPFELAATVWGYDDGAHKTTIKFLREGKTLFIKAECAVLPGAVLKTAKRERGAPVWEDESLEIFLSRRTGKAQQPLFNYAVSAAGGVCESKDYDASVRLPWTFSVSSEKNRWTASLAIPLENGVYGINICRNIYNQNGDYSLCLALDRSGYYSPSVPLLIGTVSAKELSCIAEEALQGQRAMSEMLSAADKKLYQTLQKKKEKLDALKDAAVTTADAAETVSIADSMTKNTQASNKAAMLNFMFGGKR